MISRSPKSLSLAPLTLGLFVLFSGLIPGHGQKASAITPYTIKLYASARTESKCLKCSAAIQKDVALCAKCAQSIPLQSDAVRQQALTIAAGIKDPWERANTFLFIARERAPGEPVKASAIFEQAVQVANAISEPERKETVLSGLAAEWANQDFPRAFAIAQGLKPENKEPLLLRLIPTKAKTDPVNALEIASSLQNTERKIEALIDIAEIWAQSDPIMAQSVFEQAFQLAETALAGKSKERTMSAIATAWAPIDPQKALEIANGQIKVPSLKDPLLGQIAYLWVKRREPEKALPILNSLSDDYNNSLSLEKVINLWAYRDPVRAMEVADQFKRPALKQAALKTLIDQLIKSDLQKALDETNKLQNDNIKASAFTQIAFEWRQSDPAKALALLEQSIEAAKRIESPKRRDQTLNVLIHLQAQIDLQKAQESVEMIQDDFSRDLRLHTLSYFWKKTDLAKAQQLANLIQNPQLKNWAFEGIAYQVAKSDLQKGLEIATSILDENSKAAALRSIALEIAKTDQAQALNVFHLIENPGNRLDALLRAAPSIAKTAPPLGLTLLKEALQLSLTQPKRGQPLGELSQIARILSEEYHR